MASLCPVDSNKVAYMYLEKQKTYQDSCLLDPSWRTSLSFLIFLMVIRKSGVNVNGFLMPCGFQEGSIHVF